MLDARRADLLGETVVAISQRVLVTADITDRDAPDVLAEVSLAWPVDRVLDAGAYLLQIEDGGRWYASGSRATLRVSPADAPEQGPRTDRRALSLSDARRIRVLYKGHLHLYADGASGDAVAADGPDVSPQVKGGGNQS